MTAEEIIQVWKTAAEAHGYVLHKKPGLIEKAARMCAGILKGACICKPKERPTCPCNELHEDIKNTGSCFCKIFFDPNWQTVSK